MCNCPRDRLCDTCLANGWATLRGVAARRADGWLDSLPADVRARPWPGYTDKVAAIAMRKVVDLSSDPRLRAMLAAECASWVAKRWAFDHSSTANASTRY